MGRSGDVEYAPEKFALAVHVLATGARPIKDRLYSAFTEFVAVSERDVPAELLDDYRWVRAELTRHPSTRSIVRPRTGLAQPEGRLAATLRTMRKDKAVAIA